MLQERLPKNPAELDRVAPDSKTLSWVPVVWTIEMKLDAAINDPNFDASLPYAADASDRNYFWGSISCAERTIGKVKRIECAGFPIGTRGSLKMMRARTFVASRNLASDAQQFIIVVIF
jgi:hypothetical protein